MYEDRWKRFSLCQAVLLTFLMTSCTVFLGGCQRIYWDENWIYEGLTPVPLVHPLHVESVPPADLWVDGKYAGKTPLEIRIPYRRNRIQLVKRKYKETSGKEREVLEEKERQEEVIEKNACSLHFRAAGFHDRFLSVRIPEAGERVRAVLEKKAGASHPVHCRMSFRCSAGELEAVEKVIRRYALPGSLRILSDEKHTGHNPSPTGDKEKAGYTRRSFAFTVPDDDALDTLNGAFFSLAQSRHLRFEIRNAEHRMTLHTNPEREFRGVWISYLDWPGASISSKDNNRHLKKAEAEKERILRMLDAFRELNINTLFFQVRIEGDALYQSAYEPWSRLLTGKQGKAPGFDPLNFFVQESHRRGMDIHAWVNPFRLSLLRYCNDSRLDFAPGHAARTHPDWVLKIPFQREGKRRCYRMLDPGIPDVVTYIAAIIEDIVRRYDVDGIHFDDMFYPYPEKGFRGIGNEDFISFQRYGRKAGSRGAWRRENINTMIRTVCHRIKSIKKHVRFGVSPFGIWRSGTPEGIEGMDAPSSIYADALAWLREGTVDYLSPQLYWKNGGKRDYGRLMAWWGEQGRKAGRHIYPGHLTYYLNASSAEFSGERPKKTPEIMEQIDRNRDHRALNVLGNVFYRAVHQNGRVLGESEFTRGLSEGNYATPAIPPVMPWLDTTTPKPPENLRIIRNETGETILDWGDPNSDEQVNKYGIYVSRYEDLLSDSPLGKKGVLLAVSGERMWRIDPRFQIDRGDLLSVTAISRNQVESPPSRMVGYTPSVGNGERKDAEPSS